MLLEANDLIPRFFYRVISARFMCSLQIGYSLAIVMENVGVRFCGGVESPPLRLAPGVFRALLVAPIPEGVRSLAQAWLPAVRRRRVVTDSGKTR